MSTVRQTYAAECRGCGRQVSRQIPIKKNKTIPNKKRVRCKECRTTNACEPSTDGLEA